MWGIDIASILSLTMPFIFVIAIVWLKNVEKQKRDQLRADLYAKAIENGQPVPADLFAESKSKPKEFKPLNTGIILVAVGIGISLFFYLMSIAFSSMDQYVSNSLISVASVGVIPFLIGVAFFVIHFTEKKKAADKDAK